MRGQSIDDEKLIRLRQRLIKKQSEGKPEAVKTYIRRSLSTAIIVLNKLQEIDFRELSVSLYFITKDSHMAALARIYEAELELASIDSEKFMRGIHKFYNETALKIKKENLYREFFAFLSETNMSCDAIRLGKVSPSKVNINVLDCYQSLLLQQLEYLRPSKFDFTTRCCGISTAGEILTCKDSLPYVDSATDEVESAFIDGKLQNLSKLEYMAYVSRVFAKYGYKVRSLDEMEALMECDRVEVCQISTMIPFINEYTYDIVPQEVTSPNCVFLQYFHGDFDLSVLKEGLKHRRRMLPTNGQIFDMVKIDNIDNEYLFFKKVLLRESFYQGRLYLLYKMETTCGEFSGFYEPMNEDFFSVMRLSLIHGLDELVQKFILYLYGSCVLADGDLMWQRAEQVLRYDIPDTKYGPGFSVPLKMFRFARGGKVRPAIGEDKDPKHLGPKKGNDKYEEETRAIQGYIRKLGAGRSPSPEAIARAEALGFSLSPDETYVQPHLTTVYITKKI